MKACGGEEWTASDPWWQGWPAAVRYYARDGTMLSKDPAGTAVYLSLCGPQERRGGHWRFVPGSSGHFGPPGSFLRHSQGGRDFPTHFVSRYPENWGWILQNCWGFSASFPLPLRGVEPELEDDGSVCQSVTVATCRDEVMRFNRGLLLPHETPEEDEDVEESDEDSDMITLHVNGQDVQLPREMVMMLIETHQFMDAGDTSNGSEATE